MMKRCGLFVAMCCAGLGCGPSFKESPRDVDTEALTDGRGPVRPNSQPIVRRTTPGPVPAAVPEEPPQSRDAPEISRSPGVKGGAVVLWPRIVLARGEKKPDAETVAIARKIQQKLAAVARQSLAGAPVDVRPEPQRVCTQTGCVGVSVGALLAKVGKGCAVVALVSRPGQSPQRLVAWAGRVTLKAAEVPFRSHPEGSVGFPDFASCSSLIEQLATNDGPVVEAIREAAR